MFVLGIGTELIEKCSGNRYVILNTIEATDYSGNPRGTGLSLYGIKAKWCTTAIDVENWINAEAVFSKYYVVDVD
jgi:hypothetical protein